MLEEKYCALIVYVGACFAAVLIGGCSGSGRLVDDWRIEGSGEGRGGRGRRSQ